MKNNFENFLKDFKRIQICSYDSGGANVLAHLALEIGLSCSFIVDGPAYKIYNTLFPNFNRLNTINISNETDLLISSTGWQSSFEFEIMEKALSKNIPIIAVMDHWVNYSERFKRYGRTVCPNYFLTFDSEAENKILQEFPEPIVFRTENRYLLNILKEIKAYNSKKIYDFTFIGEPLSRSSLSYKWNEFDSLNQFFEALRINNFTDSRIYIRTHPSEDSNKYNSYIPAEFRNVTMNQSFSLSRILAASNSVIGCHSMALYIAELSGIKVYTSLPEGISSMLPLKTAVPVMNLSHACSEEVNNE